MNRRKRYAIGAVLCLSSAAGILLSGSTCRTVLRLLVTGDLPESVWPAFFVVQTAVGLLLVHFSACEPTADSYFRRGGGRAIHFLAGVLLLIAGGFQILEAVFSLKILHDTASSAIAFTPEDYEQKIRLIEFYHPTRSLFLGLAGVLFVWNAFTGFASCRPVNYTAARRPLLMGVYISGLLMASAIVSWALLNGFALRMVVESQNGINPARLAERIRFALTTSIAQGAALIGFSVFTLLASGMSPGPPSPEAYTEHPA